MMTNSIHCLQVYSSLWHSKTNEGHNTHGTLSIMGVNTGMLQTYNLHHAASVLLTNKQMPRSRKPQHTRCSPPSASCAQHCTPGKCTPQLNTNLKKHALT